MARRLADPPDTLVVLSQRHDVSRGRIRQIEARAFEQLKAAMSSAVAAEDGGTSEGETAKPEGVADQSSNGSFTKIVSSRSGLVERSVTGAPISSSI